MAYYGWRDGWYDPWQPRDTWHWQEDDWQWSAWQHRDEAWQQRDEQMGSWQAEGQEGWRHSDRQDEPDEMLNGKPMLSGKDGIGMDGGMMLLIRAGTGSGRMVAMIVGTSVADTRWVIRLLKSRNPR